MSYSSEVEYQCRTINHVIDSINTMDELFTEIENVADELRSTLKLVQDQIENHLDRQEIWNKLNTIEDIAQSGQNYKSIEDDIESVREACSTLRSICDGVEERVREEYEDDIYSLESEVDDLKHELDDFEDQLAEAENTITTLEAERKNVRCSRICRWLYLQHLPFQRPSCD